MPKDKDFHIKCPHCGSDRYIWEAHRYSDSLWCGACHNKISHDTWIYVDDQPAVTEDKEEQQFIRDQYTLPEPVSKPPQPFSNPPVFSSNDTDEWDEDDEEEDIDEWDEDEDEDEEYEEDEDDEDEEDYIEKPPAFVSTPPSKASAPAYQGHDRHQPEQGKSRLGRDIQTGKYVDVSQASRRQGLYIIGIQGTGKSVLIENLIIQDIKQNNIGVCVLDPHGDLINAVLSRLPEHRVKDVIYLNITDYHYPFGLNLFTCSDPTNPLEVQKIVDQVKHIFEKLLGVTQETQLILEYLYNCTCTLIANPGYTMADIPLLLQDEECRKKLVTNVTDSDVQLFWRRHDRNKQADQDRDIASTLRRVRQLLQPLSRNIVGQNTSTIDIRQVMDGGKILLVKLDTAVETITELIGSLFIALLLNAAQSRADMPANKRRQFNLYADEFQRFSTEDFATLLEEARKYGVATTIAHQNRGQLDAKNSQLETNLKDRTRSAANLIVFRVNSKDAGDLAGEFDITPQEAWEEEIEPEWVEVVKPQWHERIEEQVEVEVEVDIEEISQNPIDFLVSARGTHGSKTVREITQNFLSPLMIKRENDKETKQMINQLLVDVMEGRLQTETIAFAERLYALKLWQSVFSFIYYNHGLKMGESMRKELMQMLVLGHDDFDAYLKPLIKKFTNGLIIHPYTNMPYTQVYDEQLGRWVVEEWDKVAQTHRPRPDIESKIERLSREIAIQTDEEIDRQYAERIKELLNEIASETREKRSRYNTYHAFRQCVQDQFMAIVSFYSKFIVLFEELKREPILVPTGKKRMVKRIQPHITYITHESEKITHPRKTILHPQRTYADMLNEVASELTNLPVFTARVKITTDNGIEEHTIRTLDPKQDHDRPLFGQALQDRIDSIKTQNIQNGYLRKQAEVEAEIRQRQEQCSQPPEAEPPISRRPNR